MENKDLNQTTHRRGFLGTIAAGAAAIGVATIGKPFQLAAEARAPFQNADDADAWFNKIKGKHRIMFDVTRPNEIMPFAWPRVYLLTNQATGSAANDSNVVVVLRHDGIPYAFKSEIWAKYNFGEVFKANDPLTKKPSVRNPFWKPTKGDYKAPGIGVVDIGIDELQDSGVMFCVCDVAVTIYSAALAEGMKMDAAEVKKDWLSGLLPGVQVVPSGVWAVGRAQEHGCAYCYAG